MASRRFQNYVNHSDTDDESVEDDEESLEKEEDDNSVEEEESVEDEDSSENESAEEEESTEDEEESSEEEDSEEESSEEEDSEDEYDCGEEEVSGQEEDSNEDGESADEEESSSEEEDSDDNEHLKLYHYTSESGYKGMKKNRKILPSSINAGDAILGKGVYLTHLPPTENDAKIISNNWDRGEEISNYFIHNYLDKIGVCIEFNSKDLPGVIEYSGDRDVVLYPGTINLNTVPYKVHYRG